LPDYLDLREVAIFGLRSKLQRPKWKILEGRNSLDITIPQSTKFASIFRPKVHIEAILVIL